MRKILSAVLAAALGLAILSPSPAEAAAADIRRALYQTLARAGITGSSATYFLTNLQGAGLNLTLEFANGATVSNATDGSIILSEASEDLRLAFTSNTLTLSSSTSLATLDFGTIAPTFGAALTLSSGLTVSQSANNVLTFTENNENVELTFASNRATFGSTTGALISIPVDILTVTTGDLVAGACTAGTLRIDTGGGTRELCLCNAGGTAYDCWSATTANGPSD